MEKQTINGIGDIIAEVFPNTHLSEQHYLITDQNYYQYELTPLACKHDYTSSPFWVLKSTIVMYYTRVV